MFGKKNKLVIILGTIALVLIVFAVIGKKKGWIGGNNATKVSTEKVSKHDITEKVSASGKIYPVLEVKISPDVSGEIVELNVEEGDSVSKGQLLLRIKPDIYQAMLDQSMAALNSSKAQLLNAKAQLTQVTASFDQAEKNYNRNKLLFEQKVISTADFENIETAYKQAQAQKESAQQSVDAATFQVQSAEAGVKQAHDNLEKTNIYAPVSGIVSSLLVKLGERVVGTSQMAGTEMLRIANLYSMEARVDVSESDVLRVIEGDTALIEVDAYPGRKFKGVVYQVANSSDNLGNSLGVSTDQVTNFTVKILLDKTSYADLIDADHHKFPFLPGMSASVNILTKSVSQVVAVPIGAVTSRDDTTKTKKKSDEEVKYLVFVYADGKVKSTNVTTGIQDDEYIEIKEGLKGDEEVVAYPYSAISRFLKDDMKVEKVDKDKLFESTETK